MRKLCFPRASCRPRPVEPHHARVRGHYSSSASSGAARGLWHRRAAANASGAEVILASDNINLNIDAYVIEICATTDGVHWSGPTAVGNGQEPVAVVAPNGRAVLVWLDEILSTGAASIQGSILPPGGSWSSPATLSAEYARPHIAMDGSGNTMAMWAGAGTSLQGAVQTSSLAASRTTWAAPTTLAPNGGLATLVGNAAGDVVVTWRTETTNLIQGVYVTIVGGFGTIVNFAQTNGYVRDPSIPAIDSARPAVVAWDTTRSGTEYATKTASGSWSGATPLSSAKSEITVTVNASGSFTLTWFGLDGGLETLTVNP